MMTHQSGSEEFAAVLCRIAATDSDEGSTIDIGAELRAVASAHRIEGGQVRAMWDDLLQVCIDAAMGITSSAAGGAALLGARFANEGHGLSQSLELVQALRHIAIESLQGQAEAEGRDETFVIAGINRISVSMNTFLLEFSNGYFRAEVANQARLRTQQDSFVWSVLSGTTRDDDAFNRLGAYGLDGAVQYRAFRARAKTDADHAALEMHLQLVGHGSDRRGISTVIDGDVCGFTTVLPDDTPQLLVGVSAPVPFAELPAGFRQATRAFNVSELAGLSGIQSLQKLGIIASVMTDRDIAAVLAASYLEPLLRLGEYGETLLHTVYCYVDSGCQVDVTARKLVLHVNTVRYRISKFEEILGTSLRETQTLAEVWWARQLPDELSRSMSAVGA